MRIADDAPVPDGVAVIVTGARFLADAEALAQRTAAVGVVWPNNRPIAELAPYLGRIALVALVFPGFRDGRAYSQARILRERYGFGGELRATGQVLRDQFLFLLRAGFDSFEVSKEADAAAFAESIQGASTCSTSRPATAAPPRSAGASAARSQRASRQRMSRKSGHRFSEKDMRRRKKFALTPCDTGGRTGS